MGLFNFIKCFQGQADDEDVYIPIRRLESKHTGGPAHTAPGKPRQKTVVGSTKTEGSSSAAAGHADMELELIHVKGMLELQHGCKRALETILARAQCDQLLRAYYQLLEAGAASLPCLHNRRAWDGDIVRAFDQGFPVGTAQLKGQREVRICHVFGLEMMVKRTRISCNKSVDHEPLESLGDHDTITTCLPPHPNVEACMYAFPQLLMVTPDGQQLQCIETSSPGSNDSFSPSTSSASGGEGRDAKQQLTAPPAEAADADTKQQDQHQRQHQQQPADAQGFRTVVCGKSTTLAFVSKAYGLGNCEGSDFIPVAAVCNHFYEYTLWLKRDMDLYQYMEAHCAAVAWGAGRCVPKKRQAGGDLSSADRGSGIAKALVGCTGILLNGCCSPTARSPDDWDNQAAAAAAATAAGGSGAEGAAGAGLLLPQPLGLPELLVIIRDAMLGLDHMAQHNMSHRDVKAQNLLVQLDPVSGELLRVSVNDPGIAYVFDPRDGGCRKMPGYTSREVIDKRWRMYQSTEVNNGWVCLGGTDICMASITLLGVLQTMATGNIKDMKLAWCLASHTQSFDAYSMYEQVLQRFALGSMSTLVRRAILQRQQQRQQQQHGGTAAESDGAVSAGAGGSSGSSTSSGNGSSASDGSGGGVCAADWDDAGALGEMGEQLVKALTSCLACDDRPQAAGVAQLAHRMLKKVTSMGISFVSKPLQPSELPACGRQQQHNTVDASAEAAAAAVAVAPAAVSANTAVRGPLSQLFTIAVGMERQAQAAAAADTAPVAGCEECLPIAMAAAVAPAAAGADQQQEQKLFVPAEEEAASAASDAMAESVVEAQAQGSTASAHAATSTPTTEAATPALEASAAWRTAVMPMDSAHPKVTGAAASSACASLTTASSLPAPITAALAAAAAAKPPRPRTRSSGGGDAGSTQPTDAASMVSSGSLPGSSSTLQKVSSSSGVIDAASSGRLTVKSHLKQQAVALQGSKGTSNQSTRKGPPSQPAACREQQPAAYGSGMKAISGSNATTTQLREPLPAECSKALNQPPEPSLPRVRVAQKSWSDAGAGPAAGGPMDGCGLAGKAMLQQVEEELANTPTGRSKHSQLSFAVVSGAEAQSIAAAALQRRFIRSGSSPGR